MARRLRVLILSYATDREDISEPWYSYQWVSRLGCIHEVTVLVQSKVERAGTATAQLPHCRVIEWPDGKLFTRFERFNAMLKPGYLRYYMRARGHINRLLQEENFDLIHQLAPLAPRYPSPGVGWGVPLVLGPVGGGLPTPPGFRRDLGGPAWYTRLRSLDGIRLRRDPWLRNSYARASLVLGVAPYMREVLADVPIRSFEVMNEVGVESLPEMIRHKHVDRQRRLRLLYVGRVVRTKGLRDALRAMPKSQSRRDLSLEVIGDGPDRASCEAEVARRGLGAAVRFRGRLPRREIDAFYAQSDVFIFPSFRETTGGVLLEAMSHGLPCICASNGGPGYIVDDSCGIRVTPQEPEQYARDLAAAIDWYHQHRDQLFQMGMAARKRVKQMFLWDTKIAAVSKIYDRLLLRDGTADARP